VSTPTTISPPSRRRGPRRPPALARVWSDSLYRNSILLLTNSVVLALLALVYWALAARCYPVADGRRVLCAQLGVRRSSQLWPGSGSRTPLVRHLARTERSWELLVAAAWLARDGPAGCWPAVALCRAARPPWT